MGFKTELILLSLLFLPLRGEISANEEPSGATSVITVAAVGDIMMGTDYPSPKLPKKDGGFLFEESKEILGKADIVFGNLEGPLYDRGSPAKKVKDRESYVFQLHRDMSRILSMQVLMSSLLQTITREILDIRECPPPKKFWMPQE